MEANFDKDSLAIEQNNFLKKLVNDYIVFHLDNLDPKFKNCLYGATSILKKRINKVVYSGYGMRFDGAGSWSFDNGTARNVLIFGVDNSSSSYVESKNNFLVLGEGPTFRINGSFGSPEKNVSINFSKANTKLCLGLHYNADNSYLFANRNNTSFEEY